MDIKMKFISVPRFVTNPSVLTHIQQIATDDHINAVEKMFINDTINPSTKRHISKVYDNEIGHMEPIKKQKLSNSTSNFKYINTKLSNGDCFSFAIDSSYKNQTNTYENKYNDELKTALKLSEKRFNTTQECPICYTDVFVNEYSVHVNACLDAVEFNFENKNDQFLQCDSCLQIISSQKFILHKEICYDMENSNSNTNNLDNNKNSNESDNEYKLVLQCVKDIFGDKWNDYFKLFVAELMDDEAFLCLEKSDLKGLGFKVGQVIKIKKWVDKYNSESV